MTRVLDPAADRIYCRTVLPRVSRTFALNIRLLTGRMGEAVRTAYLMCRAADALEDSWPGESAAIARRFDVLLAAFGGDALAADELAGSAASLSQGQADLDLLAHLPRLCRTFQSLPEEDRTVVLESVTTLALGMRRYACRAAERDAALPYLADEAELHDYCWVVAGCVGFMLTRLFVQCEHVEESADAGRRLDLAPTVGEALQLTNILLDWPVDVRRGRCHVPAEWLSRLGLVPADLVHADRPGVAEIAARLEAMALDALARVPDYLETIPERHLRYRLFCLWPTLWARDSLRHARRDPDFPWGSRRPRLPRHRIWSTVARSLIVAKDAAAIRRLLAAD